MKRRATDVIHVLEQWAPTGIQEPWDNPTLYWKYTDAGYRSTCMSGLYRRGGAGSGFQRNQYGCNSPSLIFKGLKHLREETPVERTVALAIKTMWSYIACTRMQIKSWMA